MINLLLPKRKSTGPSISARSFSLRRQDFGLLSYSIRDFRSADQNCTSASAFLRAWHGTTASSSPPRILSISSRISNRSSSLTRPVRYSCPRPATVAGGGLCGHLDNTLDGFGEPDASRIRQVEAFLAKPRPILADLGYTVVRVPTRAYELTGGIHCLVNALQ